VGIAGKVQANERDKFKLLVQGKLELYPDVKPRKSVSFTFWLQFKYSILVLLTALHGCFTFICGDKWKGFRFINDKN
jgi:hypothetical protein